jgi:hypothetical protein
LPSAVPPHLADDTGWSMKWLMTLLGEFYEPTDAPVVAFESQ